MIDIPKALEAIAWKESSSGKNNFPRCEAAFIPKGVSVIAQNSILRGTSKNVLVNERWDKWGVASACSFGPWQILYHTAADRGFDGAPWELWGDSEEWVRKQIDYLIGIGKNTPGRLFEAWNAGPGGKAPEYRDSVLIKYDSLVANG